MVDGKAGVQVGTEKAWAAAEGKAKILFVNNIDEENVDVLKVAHHGGKESSTQNFLDVVKPEFALISVGEGNKYGHPKEEVLSRLNNIGCDQVYRTDKNGTIVLTISSSTMQMSWDFSTKTTTSASVVIDKINLAFLRVVNLAKSQMTIN